MFRNVSEPEHMNLVRLPPEPHPVRNHNTLIYKDSSAIKGVKCEASVGRR